MVETMLLEIWKNNGVTEIYKYKSRIKAFREPLTNIELFYDMTQSMFQDVEDIANHNYSSPKSYKKNIEDLIQSRQ